MKYLTLFHGSDQIVEKPKLVLGKTTNDYGQGFYCTENIDLAREWAVKNNTDGFTNEYLLNTKDLKILNLLDGSYSVLNWIALLLKNRTFRLNDETAFSAKEYILENFYIDTSKYDIIIGYRADDSYFSYAQSFISNALSIKNLALALKLGQLGTQIVLVSEKAFNQLEFKKSFPVNKKIYFARFCTRDEKARKDYQFKIKNTKPTKEDIFIMDILREEISNDDPRIQRIILD